MLVRRACVIVFLGLVVPFLADCSSGSSGGSDVPDAVGSRDGSGADASAADSPAPDALAPDLPEETDAPAPAAKGFLEPCAENRDCESGFCVGHAGDQVCTRPCAADCPQAWECRQVSGLGSDALFLCISSLWALCRPCLSDADCAGPWGGGERCVAYPGGSTFCGVPCAGGGDCPAGYSCATAAASDGTQGSYCTWTAGECPCAPKSVAAGLQTVCQRTNGFGTCRGTRTCRPGGLSECAAPEAAAEVCDGLDNDCDGAIDEGLDTCCRCGNQACEAFCGEDVGNCPWDCAVCGDGTCSPGEGPVGCPEDCCGGCGDGVCRGFHCGEDPKACPADCTAPCGNQACDKGENPYNCAQDCLWQVCGNGTCENSDGGPTACPKDCAPTCGNCLCDPGEDWQACPVDCGYCGDGVCSPCLGIETMPDPARYCVKDCTPGLEVCNGRDDDGDGLTDEENALDCVPFHPDGDGDGYGVGDVFRCRCAPEPDFPARFAGDCDDADPLRSPGRIEECNGIDDDCDGRIDEEGARGCTFFFKDGDRDGFGDVAAPPMCLCTADLVTSYTATAGGDCNDLDPQVHPGVSICGMDGDCDGNLLDPGEECDDGTPGNWDGCHGCLHSEVEVVEARDLVGGTEFDTWPDGRAVVVVVRPDGLQGLILRPDGTREGEPFPVGSVSGGVFGGRLSVRTLGGERFVATWEQYVSGAESLDVAYTVMEGSKLVVPATLVNVNVAQAQTESRLAVLSGGGFVVAWESLCLADSCSPEETEDGSGVGVFARQFLADGTPAGDQFLVSVRTEGDQRYPRIASMSDGGYLVGFYDSKSYSLLGARFSAAGIRQGPERVLAEPASIPWELGAIPGGIVMYWDRPPFGYSIAVFGEAGQSLSDALSFPPAPGWSVSYRVTFGSLGPDAFVATWDGVGPGDSGGVFFQRYGAGLAPVGSPRRANAVVDPVQANGRVAPLPDHGFLTLWTLQERLPDGSPRYPVLVRRFDASGVPVVW